MNTQLRNIKNHLYKTYKTLAKSFFPYGLMKVLGPEHEFSIVNDELKPLPIVDRVIKDFSGNTVDFVHTRRFIFGKENSLQTLEIKARKPFKTPERFEETMQFAVSTLLKFLNRKYGAHLLGTGMHPLLKPENTGIWPHSNQDIIEEYRRIFNLKSQSWLNIQSFQLNLPYSNEKNAINLYNTLAYLCTYLPAISASSPICEGQLGPNIDNRLYYYKMMMQEIPSIAGDVVPEFISSFRQFQTEVVNKYSQDLTNAGAGKEILYKEWTNLRNVIFRFNREAIEIKIMDEQECIKSDVALSCFIRATIRGLLAEKNELPSHHLLVSDYNSIVKNGLSAKVLHPHGETARQVCQHFLGLASKYANENEKKYLWIVKKRIEEGNLSELIRNRVATKAQKTTFREAVLNVYLKLVECLSRNEPYF